MEIIPSKTCRDCGVEKPLEEFNRDRRRPDGRQGVCKPCRHVYLAEWEAGRSRLTERHSLESNIKRFWPNVDKGDGTGCWLWTAAVDGKGYARFYYSPLHKTISGHRFAYFLEHGVWIPDELSGCHSCDVERCVRPDHIWPGTTKENAEDMVRKGRSAMGDRNGMRTHPERQARGSRHGRALLDEGKVRDIRQAFAAGESQSSLGRRFGVSRPAIHLIVNRKKWKHVD